MKCLMCEDLSLLHLCSTCQKIHLTPSLYERSLEGIKVYSFYKYSQIKPFLFTKHTDLGHPIFTIMAQNSFAKFAQNFDFGSTIYSIAIDDHVKNGYAHAAILNSHLRCSSIKPLHAKLRAQNSISYAGKSKEFRLLNPRNFTLKNFSGEDVILVDDIITTGTTLKEAVATLKKAQKEVLFCLTLADASQEN